jgi:hypothetical protein
MPDVLWSTYDFAGAKEDVADIITNINPTDTPFQSMMKKEKMGQRLNQWQEDTLAAAAANAAYEGQDADATNRTATVMRSNYSQILQDTMKISGTTEVTGTYGRDSETAYQLAKTGKQLKRDLEFVLVGNGVQNATLGNDTTTARLMSNAWGTDVSTNAMINAGVTLSNGGTARALTEALILSAHQLVYAEGSDPSLLFIVPSDAQIVAAFTGASGRFREFMGDTKKLVNAVDLYVSPYGQLKVVINRFQKKYTVSVRNSEALLVDPDMWKILTLRDWTKTTLAKVGDAEKYQVLGEFSLKHRNYKATGRISDLNGS